MSSRLPGEKSQIVCIRHQAGMSPMALYIHLKDRNIITAPRGDRLRIAPHAYNVPAEIDASSTPFPDQRAIIVRSYSHFCTEAVQDRHSSHANDSDAERKSKQKRK
jgi:hypothetical protein